MIITTADQLRELVEYYSQFDSLVFDLETAYWPTPDERERADELRTVAKSKRDLDDQKWLEEFDLRATDAHINEVIWIGLATYGRSDAVATGHPLGSLLTPEEKTTRPASEIYDEDDPLRYSATGKVSHRKINVTIPATYSEPSPQLDPAEAAEILRPLFFDPYRRIINQNVKFDIKTMVKYFGGEFIPGPYGETQIAQNVLDENAIIGTMDLGSMVSWHLDHKYSKLGSKGVHNFSFEEAARYAEQDAKFTWLLWQYYSRALQKQGLWDLFEMEMDLLPVLMRKEYHGALVDKATLRRLRSRLEKRRDDVREKLIAEYGIPPSFNFNSTQQKQKLFFKTLGAKPGKMTESKQPSTDAESLERIVAQGGKAGAVAKLFLEYAELEKSISTYCVGLFFRLDSNSKLHPSFVQYSTDTGRLACHAPNLHNIPRGSDMRDLFIAPKGKAMVCVDYDQIELRFICTWSQDKTMQQVFLSEEDVHGSTAALILNKSLEDVTADERQTFGKMPNFLIGYGGTHYLLAAKTGISEEAAERVLKAYFSRFARIQPWKEEELHAARARAFYRDGKLVVPPYVETWLGRRRRLPHLLLNPKRAPNKESWSEMSKLLARSERQGINAVIQGSAAETLKLAMIDIQRYVDKENFPLQLILNIHDELVSYVDEKHAEEGLEIVEYHMANVVNPLTGEGPLRGFVPLVASGQVSDKWLKG